MPDLCRESVKTALGPSFFLSVTCGFQSRDKISKGLNGFKWSLEFKEGLKAKLSLLFFTSSRIRITAVNL